MSPTVATFVFQLINVLLLAGLLSWLFFRPVRAALQARVDAERHRVDELAAGGADIERQRADLDKRRQAFEAELAELRRYASATLKRQLCDYVNDLLAIEAAHLEHRLRPLEKRLLEQEAAAAPR